MVPSTSTINNSCVADLFRNRNKLSISDHKTNLLTYHMTNERHYLGDMINKLELPSLYQDNPPLRFNRYANGVSLISQLFCNQLIPSVISRLFR